MTMVAKVRLLAWFGAVACAAVVLLRSATWPGADDPAAATMAAVHVVAGALAAYLALATVLAIRLPRVAPGFVRRLVAAAVGGTLVLGPIAAGAAPQPAPSPSDAPVLHKVADDPPTTTSTTASPRTPDAGASEVTVAPGDHLWGIAERTVAQRLGRGPTEAEVATYWSRLVDANRDRLATGDPDLIFAGQVFRLPS